MAYLYRHIRLDKNIPFYIGIGSDSDYGRAFGKESRNRFWRFVVNKTAYDVEIIIDDISWEEACKKEIEFIALYGRTDKKMGSLVNLTDGGDGSLGVAVSDETKAKLSNALKGKVFSKETREKLSAKAKERECDTERIKELAKINTGRKHSEERNKQISKTLKALYASGARVCNFREDHFSEECRLKLSVASTGRKHTDEAKKKMSEKAMGNKRNLGKRLSEETKKKIGDANRGKVHTEETRLKNSIGHLGRKLTDEQKKKISEALKGKKKTKKAHIKQAFIKE
jgi:hypothetical protein